MLLELDHPYLSLRHQCRLLEINRSSLYDMRQAQQLSIEQLDLLRIIDEIYTRYPFFGTRQMAQYLNQQGYQDIKRHHTRWAYEKLGLQSAPFIAAYTDPRLALVGNKNLSVAARSNDIAQQC